MCSYTLPSSGILLEMDSSDPRHFVGVLHGPADTPYEGGVYRVDINIPTDYPFGPPKMKFITKVLSPIGFYTFYVYRPILISLWVYYTLGMDILYYLIPSLVAEGMAPEHFKPNRGDMFGHTEGPVESSTYN